MVAKSHREGAMKLQKAEIGALKLGIKYFSTNGNFFSTLHILLWKMFFD
jgi:hypothetical protein